MQTLPFATFQGIATLVERCLWTNPHTQVTSIIYDCKLLASNGIIGLVLLVSMVTSLSFIDIQPLLGNAAETQKECKTDEKTSPCPGTGRRDKVK